MFRLGTGLSPSVGAPAFFLVNREHPRRCLRVGGFWSVKQLTRLPWLSCSFSLIFEVAIQYVSHTIYPPNCF